MMSEENALQKEIQEAYENFVLYAESIMSVEQQARFHELLNRLIEIRQRMLDVTGKSGGLRDSSVPYVLYVRDQPLSSLPDYIKQMKEEKDGTNQGGGAS